MSVIARNWEHVRAALADEKARNRALTRVDEIAFLPAALEIIERPVSPTGRATAWALLIGLLLSVLWLTFGQIDVVASAPGKLIPADHVKLVQPAAAGIVRAILVRDGQHVKRGQPLIELDPTVSTADAVQARKALEAAELDAARNRAILSALGSGSLNFVAPAGTLAEVVATQSALARAQFDQIIASAATHGADREAAAAARAEATGQAAKLTETLPLLDEQIEANEKLLAKGYVSKLKVIEMRRQRLAAARDRDIALDTAMKASAQMRGSGSSMVEARAEARVHVLSDLAKAEGDVRQRREELTKAGQRSSLQRLLSPVDGSVAQLSAHTVGGVVEEGKPIMIIVPADGGLVAEVKLLNRDAGFVHVGQDVALKLEAFPFTRYGTVPGQVESVGSDAVSDEKLGLIYTARIRILRAAIRRGSSAARLTPGMEATADIKTGQRSLLSYLMSPIEKARLEAGRER